MRTHTVPGHVIDSLRDVGQRLPTEIPGGLDWPDVEWPDDLVARVIDDLDAVKTAVTPAAAVAAGAGVQAASSTRRLFRTHPVLVAAGIGAAIALVIWMRRRRAAPSDAAINEGPAQRVSQVA